MKRKLIMPKQTGQKDAFYASLQLYYNSHKRGEQWYSNNDFKNEIQKLLPELSKGAQDGPYLAKQSELTRYFKLAEYDYSKQTGRAHITDRGIRFYNAYLSNDIETQKNIIMESILTDSFGRRNTAIKSSDSDIDPPKLFLKAIVDLDGITTKGLAYLLHVTHDLQINYSDAIAELSKTDDRDREIPIENANKYKDVKFTSLLTSLGITKQEGHVYSLSEFTEENYLDRIKKMSIYNKLPELTLTLDESDENENNSLNLSELLNEDLNQDRIVSSFTYNLESDKFQQQNNRMPQSIKTKYGMRFKTNPRLAKTALEIAEYKCEFNPAHLTFESKLGKPFMEAHHLIPMHAQKDFNINIDRTENIISLCPICHSGIHLGNQSTRLEILKEIYDQNQNKLKSLGINISFGELFSKYYN